MSATKAGFNLRQTAGYVTDGSDETYVRGDGDDQYDTPRSIGGTTWHFGWTDFSTYPVGANDNAGVDRRLAGHCYVAFPSVPRTFRVDVPAPGAYNVRFALGSVAGGMTDAIVRVKDGGSTLFSITNMDTSANEFYDAQGNKYSTANWPGSNAQRPITMSGTALTIEIDTAWDYCFLAHVEIEQAGGSPDPSTLPLVAVDMANLADMKDMRG